MSLKAAQWEITEREYGDGISSSIASRSEGLKTGLNTLGTLSCPTPSAYDTALHASLRTRERDTSVVWFPSSKAFTPIAAHPFSGAAKIGGASLAPSKYMTSPLLPPKLFVAKDLSSQMTTFQRRVFPMLLAIPSRPFCGRPESLSTNFTVSPHNGASNLSYPGPDPTYLHNILFPETSYELISIARDMGELRFVLKQKNVSSESFPTDDEVECYLMNQLGLSLKIDIGTTTKFLRLQM